MRISKNQQNIARLQRSDNIARAKRDVTPSEEQKTDKPAPEQTVKATRQERTAKLSEFSATGQLRLTKIQEQLKQATRAQEVAGKLEQMGADGKAQELGFGKEGLAEGMGGKTFGGKLGVGGLTLTQPERGTGLEGTWNPKDGAATANPFKTPGDLADGFRAGDSRIMTDLSGAFRSGGTQTSESSSIDYVNSSGDRVFGTTTTTTDHETGFTMTDTMTQVGEKSTQTVVVRDANGNVVASSSSEGTAGSQETSGTSQGAEGTGQGTEGTGGSEGEQQPEAPTKKTQTQTPVPDSVDYSNMPEVDPEKVESEFYKFREGMMAGDRGQTTESAYSFKERQVVPDPGSDGRDINWGPDGGAQQESGITAPDSHRATVDTSLDGLRGGDPLEPGEQQESPEVGPDGISGGGLPGGPDLGPDGPSNP
jgi:hypothetical protein